jgi:hypothetical protein
VRSAIRGARSAREIFTGANLEGKAGTLASKIKAYHGGRLTSIFSDIQSINTRLGANRGNIHLVLSELTHPWMNKREGAVFVLQRALAATGKVTFEVTRKITSATGDVFTRRIDFIDDIPGVGQVWHEVQKWNWTRWGGFPPARPSVAGTPGSLAFWAAAGRWSALRHKETQFLTALIELGPAAGQQLRLTFPAGLSPQGQQNLRNHFIALAQSAYARRLMVNPLGQNAVIQSRRYQGTVGAVRSNISSIIEFR